MPMFASNNIDAIASTATKLLGNRSQNAFNTGATLVNKRSNHLHPLSPTIRAIDSPIARDAVAAGEGALQTCVTRPLVLISKSSSS